MSEAVIYSRFRATTRIVGTRMEFFTPQGEWVVGLTAHWGNVMSARMLREGFDCKLRDMAREAANSWSEARLNGLQDAADRLEGKYGPQRRRWIAKLMRAREAGQDAREVRNE